MHSFSVILLDNMVSAIAHSVSWTPMIDEIRGDIARVVFISQLINYHGGHALMLTESMHA